MIGIIGAMSDEIEVIKKHILDIVVHEHKTRTFYTGTIHGKEIVLVQAGIGKTNAAITTTLIIEKFNPKCIINIGVAGGQNGVKHKDVIISSEVLYHDVCACYFSDNIYGQVPGHEPTFIANIDLIEKTNEILNEMNIDHKIGKIATGDQFVLSVETVKGVNELYNDIYAIEMEAAAIAHTATIYDIPFIVYRSISDVLDDDNQGEDFNKFLHEASENAGSVLLELIKVI